MSTAILSTETTTGITNVHSVPRIPLVSGVRFTPFDQPVAIVAGAGGVMGAGIATNLVLAGYMVIFEDVRPDLVERGRKIVEENLRGAVKAKKLTPERFAEIIRKRLIGPGVVLPFELPKNITANELAERFLESIVPDEQVRRLFKSATLFVEAIPEDGDKKTIFSIHSQLLQANGNPNQVTLATNTSSLLLEDIFERVLDKSRAAGLHFNVPAHINPQIEIGRGNQTSDETVWELETLVRQMGKKSLVCNVDRNGLVGNAILVVLINQQAILYDEGKGPLKFLDQLFLDTMYGEQTKAKTPAAVRQFRMAPRLGLFEDQKYLYKKIAEIDKKIPGYKARADHDAFSRKKLEECRKDKLKYLGEAIGNLNQARQYLIILQNFEPLGYFYKPAPCILKLQEPVDQKLAELKKLYAEASSNNEKLDERWNIKPYEFPKPESKILSDYKDNSLLEGLIRDRFDAIYTLSEQELVNIGMARKDEIDQLVMEALKWWEGSFARSERLRRENKTPQTDPVENLQHLAYVHYPRVPGPEVVMDVYPDGKKLMGRPSILSSEPSGIARPTQVISSTEEELAGVRTEVMGNIGLFTLGRQDLIYMILLQNSLTPAALRGIRTGFRRLADHKDVEAIIVRSIGGGEWCGGANLRDVNDDMKWDTDKVIEYLKLGNDVFDEIEKLPIPTIGQIDGPDYGGGVEWALAFDYIAMSDRAIVKLPECGYGIVPGWGALHRLPRRIGKPLSEELICSARLTNLGKTLTGHDAYMAGLADLFVPQNELPYYIARLIQGHSEGKIESIYKKANRPPNFDPIYPVEIVDKFGLYRPQPTRFDLRYWDPRNWSLFSYPAREIARAAIRASDNPAKFNRIVTDPRNIQELIDGGRNIFKYFVGARIAQVTKDSSSYELPSPSLIGNYLRRVFEVRRHVA